jgi:hypothetical protein
MRERVHVKKRVGTAWPERESLWQIRSASMTQVVAVVESASLCNMHAVSLLFTSTP